ncbi:hypothetical protein HPB51_012805 [Rhipicephalus microplus]|uniref:SAM domain-containing protein n=1 Tax=Rhipicephalus microplus TaxID=6941 RepID=A0A9J6D9U4_RHIMP|nr:hypothetical protein HPB51_012805 [Rhipicephalus microplus]
MVPGPSTSGAVTQAVTAKRNPPQFLDSSFVKTPAMTESFPGAATSTMKLRPKRATVTITKSKLVNGKPLQVPPTSSLDSVASQASPALLTTTRQHQQESTYSLQNWDNSPEKWTVDDVVQYVSGIRGCENMAEKFRHHEIDSGALFLIKEHHLMMALNIKLGPALKMCSAIGSL